MDTQKIHWGNIVRAAKIARVNPHRLRHVLQHPGAKSALLSNRKLWIEVVTDHILKRPMEFNAELLAGEIYDGFVRPKKSKEN